MGQHLGRHTGDEFFALALELLLGTIGDDRRFEHQLAIGTTLAQVSGLQPLDERARLADGELALGLPLCEPEPVTGPRNVP